MNHFDDVDVLIWFGPGGVIGFVIVVIAVVWACWADQASANECERHGEKYVDSRAGYTLCERVDGTVVRR